MKHFSSFINALLAFSLVGGGIAGCSDDPDTPVEVVKPKAELKLDAVTARTANLTLTTENVLEYAWTVTTKTDAAAPGAADLFAGLNNDANFAPATKAEAKDGENRIIVSNLEKATHYLFYVAYSYKDAGGNVVYGTNVLSENFTTEFEFGEPKAELAKGEIGTVDAHFTLKAENLIEYAYQLSDDPKATPPAPAVLFSEGTKQAALEGDNAIDLTGLEGNKAYKLFLAYSYENEEGVQFGEVLSEEFTTQKYSQMVTFVDVDWFSIKLHLEVPEGRTFAWGFVDRDQYLFQQERGTIHPSFFEQSKDKVDVVTGPTTVTFDGWVMDLETGEKQVPLPGQSLVFMMGEVVNGEIDGYDRETWAACFDWETYIQEAGGGGGWDDDLLSKPYSTQLVPDTSLDKYWLTDYHMLGYINMKAPDHTDASVAIEELKITSKSAVFGLTPDKEGVVGFGYSYYEKGAWEELITMLGSEEGAICWTSLYLMGYSDTVCTATIDRELELGFQYVFIVIVKGNEEGTLNNVIYHEFEPKPSTKPVGDVIVTPIAAPDGDDNPYALWYNVRYTGGDAKSAKYLFNDTSEFVKALNNEDNPVTIESLFRQGNPFDAEGVAQINSAEGYNVMFDNLLDDSQYRLMISVTTDEDVDTMPDMEEEGKGWADQRTMVMPDKTPVSSSLFTDLLGDWTATACLVKRNYTTDEYYIDTENPFVRKMTIRSTTEYGELTPEIIKLYKSEEDARMWYEEFKKSAAKYDKKIKGQNRLVVDGFEFATFGMDFKSAWDLFGDKDYSSFDTDELFYAYGPKWYLEIAGGDKVTMPGDYKHWAPASSWYYYTMYMLGIDMGSKNSTDAPFDVTVSADKQTLTIEPKVIDGTTYYLSLGSVDALRGWITSYAQIGTLTLTKGWTEASAAAAKRQLQRTNPVKVANPGKPVGKHYPQTRLSGAQALPNFMVHRIDPSEIRAGYAKKAVQLNKR